MRATLIVALLVSSLLVGCGHYKDRGLEAFESVGRIRNAASRWDQEARIREAEKLIDAAAHESDSDRRIQNVLAYYLNAAKTGGGENSLTTFLAIRNGDKVAIANSKQYEICEAEARAYFSYPTDKVHPGDCEKAADAEVRTIIAETDQLQAKQATAKKKQRAAASAENARIEALHAQWKADTERAKAHMEELDNQAKSELAAKGKTN